MKIRFCGAAQEVTGSKHLLMLNDKRILLDCGMHQGQRGESYAKNLAFPFDPRSIDTMILSHAHIDHCGNIPRLVKQGFKGPIYSTSATKDVASFMLLDSAMIQSRDADYLKKHSGKRRNTVPVEPLYTVDDVTQTMNQFVGMGYERAFPVSDGLAACFYDAGHILGSAINHMVVYDKAQDRRFTLAFSGDLGRKGLPILKDPQYLPPTDYLIIESTYGDRFHASVEDIGNQLAEIVKRTAEKGGRILIPSFALERTQELVYYFSELSKKHNIPSIPIFVDSPLSVKLTDVFMAHPECFDKETMSYVNHNENPLRFGSLKYVSDPEDSKKLNDYRGPCIIISASGMAEHGRILHHLKHSIEDDKTTVLFVGFQAQNTLGRKIVDGAKVIKIFGEEFKVKANIVKIDAFSGHADRSDLIDFVSNIKGLKKIFIVHGETEQANSFADHLKELKYDVHVAKYLEEIEI